MQRASDCFAAHRKARFDLACHHRSHSALHAHRIRAAMDDGAIDDELVCSEIELRCHVVVCVNQLGGELGIGVHDLGRYLSIKVELQITPKLGIGYEPLRKGGLRQHRLLNTHSVVGGAAS